MRRCDPLKLVNLGLDRDLVLVRGVWLGVGTATIWFGEICFVSWVVYVFIHLKAEEAFQMYY